MSNTIDDTKNTNDNETITPKTYIPLSAKVDLTSSVDKLVSEPFDILNVSVDDIIHLRECMSTNDESKIIGGGDNNWSISYNDGKLLIIITMIIQNQEFTLTLPVICDEKIMGEFDRMIDIGRRIERKELHILPDDSKSSHSPNEITWYWKR